MGLLKLVDFWIDAADQRQRFEVVGLLIDYSEEVLDGDITPFAWADLSIGLVLVLVKPIKVIVQLTNAVIGDNWSLIDRESLAEVLVGLLCLTHALENVAQV